jgi:hypothetical protein
MVMHATPMIAEAANEKMVRRDMVTVLPRLPKSLFLQSPDRRTSCAREPQPAAQRRALCQCLVDLDQQSHLGTKLAKLHPVQISMGTLVRRTSLSRGCTFRSSSKDVSSNRSTLRTVFRDTLRSPAISLIVLPLIKCSCGIRAIVAIASIG